MLAVLLIGILLVILLIAVLIIILILIAHGILPSFRFCGNIRALLLPYYTPCLNFLLDNFSNIVYNKVCTHLKIR